MSRKDIATRLREHGESLKHVHGKLAGVDARVTSLGETLVITRDTVRALRSLLQATAKQWEDQLDAMERRVEALAEECHRTPGRSGGRPASDS